MRNILVTAALAGLLSAAAAGTAAADTVIVPSYPVTVGPVSTSTPAVTRTHEDESLQQSIERCAADPQLSTENIGCPQ